MSQGLPASGGNERPKSELDAIVQRMMASLNSVRVWSFSLHDEHADVLWLNEGVLGPDEHEAVRASLEIFAGEGAPTRHQYDFGDGRVALTLRSSHPGGSVLGMAMIIVDQKAFMSPTSPLAPNRDSWIQDSMDDFARWLADDVSATQARLRSLQGSSMLELALEPDAAPATEAAIKSLDDTSIEDVTPEAILAAAGLPPMPQASPTPPKRQPAAATSEPAAAAPTARAAAAPAAPTTPAAPAAPTTTPSDSPAAAAAAALDPALDRHFAALRAQPIVLFVQRLEPINAGSRIRRFETLLRTNSEFGRTHAPVAMLEAAAKRGLGSVLDRRVITDLVVWLAQNPDVWRANPVSVSVNLSSTALIDVHFLKFVELCLTKAALPRGMIAFELDATLCSQHRERTFEVAEFLAALGCTVILDDFTLRDGHLELLGLKGLRMLKLHPMLTNSIAADKQRQAIVAGIAQMACILGMHTCAKAIESSQNLRWLSALRVDFAQGFGFSTPSPLAELSAPSADAPPPAETSESKAPAADAPLELIGSDSPTVVNRAAQAPPGE